MTVVVDASVAICWFTRDDHRISANSLIQSTSLLIAPTLILAEVANVAWKKLRRGEFVEEQALAAPREIRRFINEFITLDHLVAAALDIARQIDHPVYDCIYVELARQRSATLVTLDVKLIEAVRKYALAARVTHLADWRP